MVQETQLERGNGSGSRVEADDMYEDEAYRHDERADTETTFFESDINNMEVSHRKKERLRRMLRRQEGENPGETYSNDRDDRTQQNRTEWQRRVVATQAAQLELTPHQKERAKHLILDVLEINRFAKFSIEEVSLAVISIVANEDGRWIRDEDQYKQLLREVGMSIDGVTRARKMARKHL